MDIYNNIYTILHSKYKELDARTKTIISDYIESLDVSLDNIDFKNDKISMSDGTEILFNCRINGLSQIAIKQDTNEQKKWVVIDFPPNPSRKSYLDPTLGYTPPHMDYFLANEYGIYHTTYYPYINKDNQVRFNAIEPLKTSFYGNKTLENAGIKKEMSELFKVRTLEADDYYESDFNHSLRFDPCDGSSVIGHNMAAAVIDTERIIASTCAICLGSIFTFLSPIFLAPGSILIIFSKGPNFFI